MTTWDVRRAADRFVTRTEWLTSWHSFSFEGHYDPGNLAFGALQAHNDDVVAAGAGYDWHAHRDVEIVTWVVAGALWHEDTLGHSGVLRPGQVQCTTAGSGVRHREVNAVGEAGGEPVRFVQMWVETAEWGQTPTYAVADVSGALASGELVEVVSSEASAAEGTGLTIAAKGARLLAARLRPRTTVEVPPHSGAHVYVVAGSVDVTAPGHRDQLGAGDALRRNCSHAEGPLRVTAGAEGAELLVWALGGISGQSP